MSLFNSMRTSVAGMAAQSNAISAISDNIANASTDGYKSADTQFQTLLGQAATSSYESGGVGTVVRYGITEQGTLRTTTSATDLAITGNGFFIVSRNGEGSYLTRAGSFIPDSKGNLVNAAGYQLMGYPTGAGVAGTTLTPVNVASTDLQTSPSTAGTLTANVPSTASAVAAASRPSTNAAGATYTAKTSMTVYDNLGTPDIYDIYLTKTGDNTWQVDSYPQKDAAPGGGFPYSNLGTGDYTSASLTFDQTTGKLATNSATALTLNVPNGNAVNVDLTGMTQVASGFSVTTAKADGNAPSRFDHVKISSDGTLTAVYANGAQVQSYKIPLAMVVSPDNLTPLTGNVYEVSGNSGALIMSDAGKNGIGTISSNSLEQSTVDLAGELTNMIQAQRGYEANSKVLQASSDLLSVLNRLTTN